MIRNRTGMAGCLRFVTGLVLAVSASCAPNVDDAPLLPPVPSEAIVMREYRFEIRTELPQGRTVFRLSNAGALDHELTLVRIGADQEGSVKDLLVAGGVLSTVVIVKLEPAANGIFAVDLAPGRYGLACLLKGTDAVQHLTKGMASEITVR